MNEDEIKAWLDSKTPEERAQILQDLYASYTERGEQLDVEQERATKLEDTPTPGIRDTGRFLHAPVMGEHLGALAQRGVGAYQTNRIAGQREAMARAKERAIQDLVRQMLAGGGSATPATPVLPTGAPTGPVGGPGAYPPSGTLAALSHALRSR